MNFLVDAHLPRSLCALLAARGHEAIHTLDLPEQNETKDRVLNRLSFEQQRIVITKDTDFFYSHLLQGRPWKLLFIRTGNISARDLKALIQRNLPLIETALQTHSLVEIDHATVTLVA